MKHLTGIASLSDNDIAQLLDRADSYANDLQKENFYSDALKGAVIVSLFFEPSTRTRTSFEMAAKRLGADVINWDAAHSALKKGESFSDTIAALNALRPDAIVIRHSEYGAPDYVAAHARCPVINAGDSWREHPTQALLDALTLRRARDKIKGLRVAICGDVGHSRVANSNMALLGRLGAQMRVIAPPFLMPQKFPAPGIEKFTSMTEGLPGCDIIMMLRTQKERLDPAHIPDDAAFYRDYGLSPEKLALAAPGALVMHPGPMNRGIEISDEVADDPRRSLIWKQVENAVPMRMAVFDFLLNNK